VRHGRDFQIDLYLMASRLGELNAVLMAHGHMKASLVAVPGVAVVGIADIVVAVVVVGK